MSNQSSIKHNKKSFSIKKNISDIPKVEVPKVSVPKVEVPKISVPKINTSSIKDEVETAVMNKVEQSVGINPNESISSQKQQLNQEAQMLESVAAQQEGPISKILAGTVSKTAQAVIIATPGLDDVYAIAKEGEAIGDTFEKLKNEENKITTDYNKAKELSNTHSLSSLSQMAMLNQAKQHMNISHNMNTHLTNLNNAIKSPSISNEMKGKLQKQQEKITKMKDNSLKSYNNIKNITNVDTNLSKHISEKVSSTQTTSKTNKTSYNVQKGGRMISQGGYGCVYHPSIKCNGVISKNYKQISKLQLRDFTSDNEISISNKIKKIPNFSQFFAPVLSTCNTNIRNIKDRDIKSCDIIKNKQKKSFIMMKIRYVSDKDILDDFIQTSNPSNFIHKLISSFPYLVNSLSILRENGIIHFDIKNSNILIDKKYKIPIIIDYGLSIPIDKIVKNYSNNDDFSNLTKYFYGYYPDYYIWCPEIHYINMLLHKTNKPSLDNIKSLTKKYVSNIKPIHRLFSNNFMKKYKKECINQLEKYNSMDKITAINTLLSYSSTWDNYSLAMIYFNLMYYIVPGISSDNDFIVFFTKLLLKMIHPNPKKRIVSDNILSEFETFINDKQTFKMFKQLKNMIGSTKHTWNQIFLEDKLFIDELSSSVKV